MNGNNRIVINTLERAASDDINRAQAFASATLAALLKSLLVDTVRQRNSVLDNADGATVLETAAAAPLAAVIVNGLLVNPGVGSVTIEPGFLAGVDDSLVTSGDESVLYMSDSPGLAASGVLNFTANAGGGDRIDVVECSFNKFVSETATRDVFDVPSQTFSPQLVDKVESLNLTFRIRLGTPGAGYPGHAAGWLPLAIVRTPTTAAGFDDCTLWDVRPLLADRVDTPLRTVSGVQHVPRLFGRGGIGLGSKNLVGQVEGAGIPQADVVPRWLNYRVGGRLRRSTPGIDEDFIDTDTGGGNISPTFVGYVAAPGWALYAVFPFDLPRWCRYAQDPATTGGARLPYGPLGICVISDWTAISAQPFATMQLPAACGLGAGVHPGRLLLAGMTNAGNTAPADMSYVDGVHTFPEALADTTITGDDDTHTYSLPINAMFPRGAKRVLFDESCVLDNVAAGDQHVVEQVYTMRRAGNPYEVHRHVCNRGGTTGNLINLGHEFWANLQYAQWPDDVGETHDLLVATIQTIPGAGLLGVTLRVRGWEI